MKQIDFKKYPRILEYVKDIEDKSYFKPFTSAPLDEETFTTVIHKWIDHYEKNIDNCVKNTLAVYSLTSEETGYSALGADWERRKSFNLPKRLDEVLVRKWWREKFIACISHFYTGIWSKSEEIKGGATGCLITCGFTVRLVDSDLKRVKFNVVASLNMYLNIGVGSHDEIDMY